MKRLSHWLIPLALMVFVLGGLTALASAKDEGRGKGRRPSKDTAKRETKDKGGAIPEAVRKAVARAAKGAKVGKIEKEDEDGNTVFEAEWTAKGRQVSIKLSPRGKVLETEWQVTLKEVPEAARRTILKQAGRAKVEETEKVLAEGKLFYEASWKDGDKEIEVKVDPKGKLLGREIEEADRDAAGGSKAHASRDHGKRGDADDDDDDDGDKKGESKKAHSGRDHGKRGDADDDDDDDDGDKKGESKKAHSGRDHGKRGDADDDDDDDDGDKKGEGRNARDVDEQAVTLKQLPSAARAAILKAAGKNKITEIERETKGGKTVYEAEWLVVVKVEIAVSPDGKILGKKIEAADDDDDKKGESKKAHSGRDHGKRGDADDDDDDDDDGKKGRSKKAHSGRDHGKRGDADDDDDDDDDGKKGRSKKAHSGRDHGKRGGADDDDDDDDDDDNDD